MSKVAQGALARLYGPAGGMRVVLTRTFPHTGPGRGEVFAESSFARQIAEIEAGARPPVLSVGNLDAVRDYTDVRDVVRAYWRPPREGRGRGGLQRLHRDGAVGSATCSTSCSRPRPAGSRCAWTPSACDPRTSRSSSATPRGSARPPAGSREIPLERTLADLLDFWRENGGALGTRRGARYFVSGSGSLVATEELLDRVLVEGQGLGGLVLVLLDGPRGLVGADELVLVVGASAASPSAYWPTTTREARATRPFRR